MDSSISDEQSHIDAIEEALREKGLPADIRLHIVEYVFPGQQPTVHHSTRMALGPSPALTPPTNGSSPFMKLPNELRRQIFATSLPARDTAIHPTCNDDDDLWWKKSSPYPIRNRISDLMTINSRIRDEIAEMVYEERAFVIHVHEGLLDGGIEFTNAGRQPLHFQDSSSDGRFWKFSDGEENFGFRRLKKIRIEIFPSSEHNSKHSALNTYFINQALVRLLDRGTKEEKNRITNLTVEFMKPHATGNEQGRRAIQNAEHYWWDKSRNQPRETSIHDLPNIELVLRPFANLTGCHSVNFKLPAQLEGHEPTAAFISRLKAIMTSQHSVPFVDDDLERKIEGARWAMEEYVYTIKHGAKHREVGNLTEYDVEGANRMDVDDDSEDDDNGDRTIRKRSLSPTDPASSPESETKKSRRQRKLKEWQSLVDDKEMDEDEALAQALEESQQAADDEDEAREIQRAIEASLASETGTQPRKKLASTTPRSMHEYFSMGPLIDSGGFPPFCGQGRTLGRRARDSTGTAWSGLTARHLRRDTTTDARRGEYVNGNQASAVPAPDMASFLSATSARRRIRDSTAPAFGSTGPSTPYPNSSISAPSYPSGRQVSLVNHAQLPFNPAGHPTTSNAMTARPNLHTNTRRTNVTRSQEAEDDGDVSTKASGKAALPTNLYELIEIGSDEDNGDLN